MLVFIKDYVKKSHKISVTILLPEELHGSEQSIRYITQYIHEELQNVNFNFTAFVCGSVPPPSHPPPNQQLVVLCRRKNTVGPF
jgi:pyruvate-formate lyase-activating enzyme